MTFGSVCDGIGCGHLAFEQVGMDCRWEAEIEPFPSAVLAEQFPEVENFGDITAVDFIKRAKEKGHINVLTGGTPCQSWSVAGKRGGVSDPRGQLTFRFLEIVGELKPEYVLWENVPGILSAEGGKSFEMFLDELLRLGYLLNCEILDSQNFGVAQRRRRVFVLCQRVDVLMKKKTLTSALTLAQTAGEISLDILDVLLAECGKGRKPSELKCANAKDGLRRKMLCFEAHGDATFQTWLSNSADVLANARSELEPSESSLGLGTKTEMCTKKRTVVIASSDSNESPENDIRRLYSNISSSPKINLEEIFAEARSCITSTETKRTTEQRILSLFADVVLIAEHICRSNDFSPSCLTSASSFMIVLKEFISYARPSNEQVSKEPGLRQLWTNLLARAGTACESLGDIGTNRPAQVFPVRQGVRRDSPPSREAGKGFAADVGERATGGHWDGGSVHPSLTQSHNTGGIVASNQELFSQRGSGLVPVHTTGAGYWQEGLGTLRAREQDSHENLMVMAHGQANAEITSGVCPTLSCNHEAPIATYDMRGRGNGDTVNTLCTDHASRPSDYCPVVAFAQNQLGEVRAGDIANTLNTNANASGRNTGMVAIGAFKGGQGSSAGSIGFSEHVAPTLNAADSGSNRVPTLMQSSSVRRLTPVECERLQGLPDNWTQIPWRGKPASECPDGPRYKGIGNGQTVSVMRWLAKRIKQMPHANA